MSELSEVVTTLNSNLSSLITKKNVSFIQEIDAKGVAKILLTVPVGYHPISAIYVGGFGSWCSATIGNEDGWYIIVHNLHTGKLSFNGVVTVYLLKD